MSKEVSDRIVALISSKTEPYAAYDVAKEFVAIRYPDQIVKPSSPQFRAANTVVCRIVRTLESAGLIEFDHEETVAERMPKRFFRNVKEFGGNNGAVD